MAALITGIHHVTALAGDPRENHHFYTSILGLRLVKKTVNFDDPLTYHLYFGDHRGTPRTLLTHFPHPHAKPAVHGSPEVMTTVLAAPRGSIAFWADRLRDAGVHIDREASDDGECLAFEDPHSMRMIIRETDAEHTGEMLDNDIGPAHAVIGVDSVIIHVHAMDKTVDFLTEVLGFVPVHMAPDRVRLRLLNSAPGQQLEVVHAAHAPHPTMGAGTVHHVAWRVPDEESQDRVRTQLIDAGLSVTPVMDRQYFRSIYCRIPGGVIFEFATDGPGFDIDEPIESLGMELKLPPQHEGRRREIVEHLLPL